MPRVREEGEAARPEADPDLDEHERGGERERAEQRATGRRLPVIVRVAVTMSVMPVAVMVVRVTVSHASPIWSPIGFDHNHGLVARC
ncbi:MAG: hypothetical protein SangKO_082470 [Sandaracinaceae bacterium]